MIHFIFDIDGTLVESTDFDTRLYLQAVSDVLGAGRNGAVKIHEDWDAYDHVTDSGILRQILKENEIADPDSAFAAVKSRFARLVEGHLESEVCEAMRGAKELLQKLRGSGVYRVGLATGGWKRTAIAKLDAVGIDFHDLPLCSSDEAEDRMEIMRRCLEKMPQPAESVTYFGDGPWDLRAAKGLGWGFIAVGDRLRGLHEPWIRDFEGFDELLPQIAGGDGSG